MKDNQFLIYSFDVKENQWEKIPRFRSMMPFKNPMWFAKHEDLCNICDWIEINIYGNLEFIDYRTLDVLIRISTGMLYKCNISKQDASILHHNLVANAKNAHFELNSKDLPFQGMVY